MSILTRAVDQFQFISSKLFRGIAWDSEVERYLEFEGLCKMERTPVTIVSSQFGIFVLSERRYCVRR